MHNTQYKEPDLKPNVDGWIQTDNAYIVAIVEGHTWAHLIGKERKQVYVRRASINDNGKRVQSPHRLVLALSYPGRQPIN